MQPLHPLHTVLLAGTVPVFLGALLCDVAYAQSYEIQWKNFASWSLVWGLVLGSLALAWTLASLLRVDRRGPRGLLHVALLFAAWALAFLNVLVHAGDAWSGMPGGLLLSAVVCLLAMAATWLALSDGPRVRTP